MNPIIAILLFGLLSSFWACNDKEHPTDSILDTWLCTEEGIRGVRRYNVIIEVNRVDSALITLINFHNLGFGVETHASIRDTVITITGVSDPLHSITGVGHIQRDFSAISWSYSYSGAHAIQNVEALFQRP